MTELRSEALGGALIIRGLASPNNRTAGKIRPIGSESGHKRGRIGVKTGKVQPMNRPRMANGVGQKMFISAVGRAELFRKLETDVSERIRRQDLSWSFTIKGRGRGVKDMSRSQHAWFKITGALIPYDRDIPVGFPHCLG